MWVLIPMWAEWSIFPGKGESAEDSPQIECRHRRFPLRASIRFSVKTLQKTPALLTARRVQDLHLSADSRPYPAPTPPLVSPANCRTGFRSVRGSSRL